MRPTMLVSLANLDLDSAVHCFLSHLKKGSQRWQLRGFPTCLLFIIHCIPNTVWIVWTIHHYWGWWRCYLPFACILYASLTVIDGCALFHFSFQDNWFHNLQLKRWTFIWFSHQMDCKQSLLWCILSFSNCINFVILRYDPWPSFAQTSLKSDSRAIEDS